MKKLLWVLAAVVATLAFTLLPIEAVLSSLIDATAISDPRGPHPAAHIYQEVAIGLLLSIAAAVHAAIVWFEREERARRSRHTLQLHSLALSLWVALFALESSSTLRLVYAHPALVVEHAKAEETV